MGDNILLSDGRFTTIDVPGSVFTQATGINNAGQIVGWYQDASFAYHGFLATPTQAPVPEPSTLLLLATGTVSLIGWVLWRRRKVAMKPCQQRS